MITAGGRNTEYGTLASLTPREQQSSSVFRGAGRDVLPEHSAGQPECRDGSPLYTQVGQDECRLIRKISIFPSYIDVLAHSKTQFRLSTRSERSKCLVASVKRGAEREIGVSSLSSSPLLSKFRTLAWNCMRKSRQTASGLPVE